MHKNRWVDPVFKCFTAAVAWLTIVMAVWLLVILVQQSWPSIQAFGFSFLWLSKWDAVHDRFGILPIIYGTLVSSLLAVLIALPLSIGIAIFLTELGPKWMREPLGYVIELLASIPSVIYGLWGIFLLAPFLRTYVEPFLNQYFGFLPFFQGHFYGVGMLAAALILSIMILPTMTSITREVFLTVPSSLKEGALALGSTHWEMIKLVLLPMSRSGMIGATLLGLGRALAETMAVTMVIRNRADISLSLFEPSYTMAALIANEFSEAVTKIHTSALMETGLILLVITLLMNVIARALVWSTTQKMARGMVRV
jgi:phosphate transport system permease protein